MKTTIETKSPKEFPLITITLEVHTREELLTLWHRFNTNTLHLEYPHRETFSGIFRESPALKTSMFIVSNKDTFDKIDALVAELGLK